MATIKTIKTKSLETKFGTLKVFTQTMKVRDVLTIYYVAVRGKNEEVGAVQRVLNKQRISSIKKYLLDGNIFYSTSIFLNNEQKTQKTSQEERMRRSMKLSIWGLKRVSFSQETY